MGPFKTYCLFISENDKANLNISSMADFRDAIRSCIKEDLILIHSKEIKDLKRLGKKSRLSLSDFLDEIQVYSTKDKILNSEVIRVSLPIVYFDMFQVNLQKMGISNPKIYSSDLEKAIEKKSSFKIKKLLKINNNLIEIGDIVIATTSVKNNLVSSKYNKKNKLLHKEVIPVKINKNQFYAIRDINGLEFCVEDEFGNAIWWNKKFFELMKD